MAAATVERKNSRHVLNTEKLFRAVRKLLDYKNARTTFKRSGKLFQELVMIACQKGIASFDAEECRCSRESLSIAIRLQKCLPTLERVKKKKKKEKSFRVLVAVYRVSKRGLRASMRENFRVPAVPGFPSACGDSAEG